jgi:serine/threonine protein kinase
MTEMLDMRGFAGNDTVIAGRYRLDRYLNEGGFGAVYRAAHLAYGVELREVAVKVGKHPMTDVEARNTFRDALMLAKLAANASDPMLREHFVTVYDAGRCPDDGPLAGHPYLVMEFVSGGNLSHCLRAGPFPLKRAIAYFDQILSAVAFIHHNHIAHRDLKPDNILVVRREDGPDLVKVTDFGLALEVDTLLGWVESGGDLAYLAPESFSHNISSPQSDVYMLGLVFYEMLTKINPFDEVGQHLPGADEDKQHELRRLHLTARQLEKFPLLEQHPEIRQRPALGRIIRTALTNDMAARQYANAAELRAAWEAAKKTGAAPLPDDKRPWETARRLVAEAEQCFAIGDRERGEALLRQAMDINRDPDRVPDRMLAGRGYLVMVERLLQQENVDEAGRLANEGYQRRPCRSTCLALASYFEKLDSPLAARFQHEANSCNDRE